jgi:basic membrane protein A and related proteins
MYKKVAIVSMLVIISMILAGCGPTMPPFTGQAADLKVCMVTDSGGIGDKSFNDLTWKGVQQAIDEFGVQGNYIQSTQPTDFAPNLSACKDSGATLILCVGFMMADDCKAAATANPETYYAGVDMGGFGLTNFRGVTALMEQSTYLAGYLAAATSTTGKLGWYTGIMGPPVQIFGDGFYYGMQKYNEVKGANVTMIGYDANNPGQATATGSWIDADKGRSLGQSMMDEGVDIILPVCGGVGAATAAVMQERGSGYIFGVDQDWTQTYPQYTDQILASVTKAVNVHVYDAVQRILDKKWKGEDFVLTLENGGTSLTYNPAVTVPDSLKAEIADIQAQIISGKIKIPASKAIE